MQLTDNAIIGYKLFCYLWTHPVTNTFAIHPSVRVSLSVILQTVNRESLLHSPSMIHSPSTVREGQKSEKEKVEGIGLICSTHSSLLLVMSSLLSHSKPITSTSNHSKQHHRRHHLCSGYSVSQDWVPNPIQSSVSRRVRIESLGVHFDVRARNNWIMAISRILWQSNVHVSNTRHRTLNGDESGGGSETTNNI